MDPVKLGRSNAGVSHVGKPPGVVQMIRLRERCGEDCPIFWTCPMMPISTSRANVKLTCMLNAGGNALIKRFINVYVSGEEGLINEIDHVLYSYGMDIDTAPPGIKKDYAQLLMSWHKQRFGDPRLVQESKPNLTVVINEMGSDGKVIEIPVVPVVEKGHIHGKNALLAEKLKELNPVEDPDSLFGSPVADEIIAQYRTVNTPESRGTTQGPGGRFVSLKKNDVQKQDRGTSDDESVGTEGEPEKLEKASEPAGEGS